MDVTTDLSWKQLAYVGTLGSHHNRYTATITTEAMIRPGMTTGGTKYPSYEPVSDLPSILFKRFEICTTVCLPLVLLLTEERLRQHHLGYSYSPVLRSERSPGSTEATAQEKGLLVSAHCCSGLLGRPSAHSWPQPHIIIG